MRLPSFLQRKSGPGARRTSIDPRAAQQERSRARRRLIGATVLVLLGVVGLPMIFDRAPRPLAVDIAIEIPRKDSVAPLPSPPASRVATKKEATSAVEPPAEPVPAPVVPASAARPAEPAPSSAPDKPASRATEAAEAARARAALEGRTPVAKSAAAKDAKPDAAGEGSGRFVVQVGAFSEADSAREARTRVEKLGYKTYTQSVETANGKRIRVRVGPYADRAEADKVAARIKQAGITSAVLGL